MARVYVGTFVTEAEAIRLSQWAQRAAGQINNCALPPVKVDSCAGDRSGDSTRDSTKDDGSRTNTEGPARATRLEKLHITWQFLGELTDLQIVEVKNLLQAIGPLIRRLAEPRLVIKYSKLELWPAGGTPSVAVVTPGVVDDKLAQTGALIRDTLRPYLNVDTAVERNFKFMPHLTVMRFKGQTNPNLDFLAASFSEIAPVVQTVGAINLIESHIGADTHSYESLLQLTL